jgi:hypothetical protein
MATNDKDLKPKEFKENINVPIAIPAWGFLTLLAGAIFSAGVISNKIDTVIDAVKKNDDKLASVQDKQTASIAVITNLQAQVQNHESRITTVERNVIERTIIDRKQFK